MPPRKLSAAMSDLALAGAPAPFQAPAPPAPDTAPPAPPVAEKPAPARPPLPAPARASTPGSYVAPSRKDLVKISAYVTPAARRQLREIALADDTSAEEIMRGLLNELFQRKGKPSVA